MDTLEKIGYSCLAIVAGLYFIGMVLGMVAIFPYGIIGLIVVFGIGILLIKVLKERLNNKEDDYYSKKVDK
jgi:hypothetical protein